MPRTMDIDAIYVHLKEFGKYQKFLFALACLACSMGGPPVVQDTFVGHTPLYRCKIPICDTDDSCYEQDFLNETIPFDEDGKLDTCTYYRYTGTNVTAGDEGECPVSDFDRNDPVQCSEWVYDTSIFYSSTVSEFDLTCTKAWLGPLAGSMYMVGMLIGAITIGDLADRFGRKVGIMVSVFLLGVSGCLSAISPNYIMFLVMRVFTGAGGVGLFQVSFVLAVEFIGKNWRTFCGIMIEIPFALGEAMTGILAYFIRDWRYLQVACTAPAFLLISYIWLMPESVRWLVSQQRRKEAVDIIEKVAKVNGVEMPTHLLEEPEVQVSTIDGTLSVVNSQAELVSKGTEEVSPRTSASFIDLFRTSTMRYRSLNLFFSWAVCTLVYYGLSSNSGNLGGDLFVNFIATMLVEIPSYVFAYFALDRMGRKGTLSFVLLLGGIACLISGFIPEDISWLIVTLSLVGKFGIAAAFAVVYVYSAEIFPTELRSVGVGSCSMCARIGGIVAPFIASLAHTYKPLPLIIFGLLSIISGCLIVFLPETLGTELPQTIYESEQFGKGQSIFYFSCFNKSPPTKKTIDGQES
ncbi:organic cation transporter protein-like isoform X2 [Oratosquilla oratoria]|uniref:organic cation transporter protein-like isoform X2 n=1 Tax=Oratosquilla oratoria TaxID=337810 RepID=UPI003F760C96